MGVSACRRVSERGRWWYEPALEDAVDTVGFLSTESTPSTLSTYGLATPRRAALPTYRSIPSFNSISERSISSTRSLNGKIRCASARQKLSSGSNVAATSW